MSDGNKRGFIIRSGSGLEGRGPLNLGNEDQQPK